MWGQNSVCENSESDQSISDEEDFNPVSPATCVSLAGSSGKKEKVPLAMQLEILRGAYEQDHEENTNNTAVEKESALYAEDEVEMPEFDQDSCYYSGSKNEVAGINGDNIIKDHELHDISKHSENSGTRKSWNDNLDLLIAASVNTSCSSHAMDLNKSTDGRQSKAKQKFSFRRLHCPSISNTDKNRGIESHALAETMESLNSRTSGSSIEEAEEENKDNLVAEPAEAQPLLQLSDKHSMADLFDKIQSNTNLLHANTEQDRIIACKNSHEADTSPSSSDTNDDDQNLRPSFSRVKMQTMTDRFQEALGASLLSDTENLVSVQKPFGAGIFGKLQQVIQMERERDTDFVKKLQNGDSINKDSNCIDARILQRCLEAKLTVCHCSLAECTENVSGANLGRSISRSREMTIVFNPRVCNNIDLEVGNSIRIYPPWKNNCIEKKKQSSVSFNPSGTSLPCLEPHLKSWCLAAQDQLPRHSRCIEEWVGSELFTPRQ